MPRDLPAHPDLDHLKHEARSLQKAFERGDAKAVSLVTSALGPRTIVKLTDAQRAVAREYGFPTWARLRAHVLASRGVGEAVDRFLAAIQEQNRDAAARAVAIEPRIATESLHVAAALGRVDDVRRLAAGDATRVSVRAGNPAAEPLLFLCYSPFHGQSVERDAGLMESARLLLDAGADPNAKDGRYGVPALYAVTGPRSVLPLARLLLERGANPTDGESVFHAAERFHEDALELLVAAGADLNHTGDWGNTPLYYLLRWWDLERHERARRGFEWLLAHGADPDVRCGREQETSLHVAVRRGQSAAIVRQLLDHGADVHAARADGRTPWLLARRGGFDELAALLEQAGARPQPMTPIDRLLAACGRGDADAARQLASPDLIAVLDEDDRRLLPEAAAGGRFSTVSACLAAGFPVDTLDAQGATALHHAAINGRAELVRVLLAHGASIAIRDPEHAGTALGWACFGADVVADAAGDYEGCAEALLEAGARMAPDQYNPHHAGVRAVLRRFMT